MDPNTQCRSRRTIAIRTCSGSCSLGLSLGGFSPSFRPKTARTRVLRRTSLAFRRDESSPRISSVNLQRGMDYSRPSMAAASEPNEPLMVRSELHLNSQSRGERSRRGRLQRSWQRMLNDAPTESPVHADAPSELNPEATQAVVEVSCCLPSKFRRRRIWFVCEDGRVYEKSVQLIRRCSCGSCSQDQAEYITPGGI
ncbi:unnamed protein product [Protopolystoma xenopodis]|uniref:CTCK domain-containing protein n=1 Tax=Protopolystoma xenopodis TaxID=117903 RepID=A0A3S5CII3_9PLAT|nr:unnamed protein product [Protopolystoma xenopodis]